MPSVYYKQAMRLAATAARFAVAIGAVSLLASAATAQLRVVTYNTAEGASSSLATVLTAIGEVDRGGVAKPIDVLSLQEQTSLTSTTQDIVDLLNGVYGEGSYARGTRVGGTTGAGRPALIYNTATVELVAERVASNTSSSGGARQTLRYQLRPVGFDASADFYVYSSHFKAGTSSSDQARRNVEATQIRSNADGLGEGASLIYTGDLNLYTSTENAYQTLLSSGPGQAFDPLNPSNTTQSWNNNSSFATFHTQSPCTSSTGNCGVGGGVDSRFDFQLTTAEVLDGEGFDLIDGSYHTFGNDGSTYNDDITDGNTVSFPGLTSFTKTQVLSALRTATDHLPVVADYQLPATLGTLVETIPSSLNLGEVFDLGVTIFNAADVVAAIGADELDYTLSVTGNLSGFFSDTDLALGGGNLHEVSFNTSTPGLKSGDIVISSNSQSAANSLVTIPVSYEVLSPLLAGDFNDDGLVDAADYTLWRDGGPLLNETVSLGSVDEDDYAAWAANYGAAGGTPSMAVPEPTCVLLMAMVGVGLSWRGCR